MSDFESDLRLIKQDAENKEWALKHKKLYSWYDIEAARAPCTHNLIMFGAGILAGAILVMMFLISTHTISI